MNSSQLTISKSAAVNADPDMLCNSIWDLALLTDLLIDSTRFMCVMSENLNRRDERSMGNFSVISVELRLVNSMQSKPYAQAQLTKRIIMWSASMRTAGASCLDVYLTILLNA
jgi:hypothetical protein